MPLDMRNQEAKSGDVIMVPLNSSFRIAIGLDRVSPPEAIDFAVMPFISTMGYGTGAGFYSSIRGPLPWVVDQVSPETYYVARFR